MVILNRRIKAFAILFCFLFSLKLSNGDISQRIISIPSPHKSLIKNFSALSHGLRKNIRVPSANDIKSCWRTMGCYFGMSSEMMSSQNYHRRDEEKEAMKILLGQYREGLEAYREEIRDLRKDVRKLQGIEDDELEEELPKVTLKKGEWDQIGLEIERWAQKIADEKIEDGKDGWKEIIVSRMCSNFNKDGRIKCYLKWMKDSRGIWADQADNQVYPCIRVQTTIDAPLEMVCRYLADEKSLPDYNALVQKHKDLEDITPYSKICWGQSPKILFVKPRDFVTFCHHRWKRDGTQVVVNQACNHDDYDYLEKTDKKSLKAYALRGGNFISPHPEDPNKTNLCIVAHANPGPDISPYWTRVAVNQLVQIEPFKLFHKINYFAKQYAPSNDDKVQLVNSSPGRSKRPGGLSQMGYACFWPNGGGLKEEVPLPQNDVISEHEPQPEIDEDEIALPRSDVISELESDQGRGPLPQNGVVSESENNEDTVPLPQNNIIPEPENNEDSVPLPPNDFVSQLENDADNEDNPLNERKLATQSI